MTDESPTPPVPERAEGESKGAPALPTFWQVARRPKWIAVLLLVLVVAGVFAFLGRWQLERAIDSARADGPDTETVVPLETVAAPQQPIDAAAAWRRVSADLSVVPGDTVLLSGRTNTAGPGWWVVAHAVEPDGASLAVAAGWAATEAEARAAAARVDAAGDLGEVRGRYLPPESPQESDFEHGVHSALAPAELVNEWREAGPTYAGYLVLDTPLGGLEAIDAPPPQPDTELNLLNLFYAIEWVIFAGAALYLWWRLVKDDVERIADERERLG